MPSEKSYRDLADVVRDAADGIKTLVRALWIIAPKDEPTDDAGYSLVELCLAVLVIVIVVLLIVNYLPAR